MFGFNWTSACPGGNGEPPPGHDRLFGLTVIAFIIMYGLIALPFLWVARPYDERWPILLLPATPFVCVLGVWKFIVWFGFRRAAILALAMAVAGTLALPWWAPLFFDVPPRHMPDSWSGTIVVVCCLTGWLMAAAALVIGPVRLVADWFRRRNATSCAGTAKGGRLLIWFNLLPGISEGRWPPDPNHVRLIRRLLIVAVVAAPLLVVFWHDVVKA